jgi:hypothetical protein
VASGAARAMFLGTIAPKIRWRTVNTPSETITPMTRVVSASMASPMSRSIRTSSAGSLIRPRAREAIVIPSWAPASCIETSDRLALAATVTRFWRPPSSKLLRLAASTANS